MRNLTSQALLTLSYTDQFSFPLSSDEVYQRLIKMRATKPQVKQALQQLLTNKLVNRQSQFYHLYKSSDLKKTRTLRAKYSATKWAETKEFVRLVNWLPGLKAIFVTGSLAMDNAKKDDDLDFMLVTSKNTLWLIRPLVTLLALWRGKARLRHLHASNSWCLNMWLTEQSLQLPRQNRNLYTAYEVCQATCIWDQADIQAKFLQENKWVKNYLPNYYEQKNSKLITPNQKLKLRSQKIFIVHCALCIVNTLVFLLQRSYMAWHLSNEQVDLQRAFFHPRKTKQLVMKRLRKSIAGLNDYMNS